MNRVILTEMHKIKSNGALVDVLVDTLRYPSSAITTDYNKNPVGDEPSCPKNVTVINRDTLVVAADVREKYPNDVICVLNLGNAYGPGGGAIYGQMAQEEELCRRTTLLPSLYEFKYKDLDDETIFRLASEGKLHGSEPLPYIDNVLYTDKVKVIKDAKYKAMKPFMISVVTAAAVRYRKVKKYSDEDRRIMTKKIGMIFEVAKDNDVDHLVLGAIGCGAFYNDPNEVAQIFKYWVDRYCLRFKTITFAVLSKRNKNYKVFKSILG